MTTLDGFCSLLSLHCFLVMSDCLSLLPVGRVSHRRATSDRCRPPPPPTRTRNRRPGATGRARRPWSRRPSSRCTCPIGPWTPAVRLIRGIAWCWRAAPWCRPSLVCPSTTFHPLPPRPAWPPAVAWASRPSPCTQRVRPRRPRPRARARVGRRRPRRPPRARRAWRREASSRIRRSRGPGMCRITPSPSHPTSRTLTRSQNHNQSRPRPPPPPPSPVALELLCSGRRRPAPCRCPGRCRCTRRRRTTNPRPRVPNTGNCRMRRPRPRPRTSR